jgi:hypothetical protein
VLGVAGLPVHDAGSDIASSNVFRAVVLEPGVHKLDDLDCCPSSSLELARFGDAADIRIPPWRRRVVSSIGDSVHCASSVRGHSPRQVVGSVGLASCGKEGVNCGAPSCDWNSFQLGFRESVAATARSGSPKETTGRLPGSTERLGGIGRRILSATVGAISRWAAFMRRFSDTAGRPVAGRGLTCRARAREALVVSGVISI